MSLFTQSKRRRAHAPAKSTAFRPALEALGDRIVPATYTMTDGGTWSHLPNWDANGQPPANTPDAVVVITTSAPTFMDLPNRTLAELRFAGGAGGAIELAEDLKFAAGADIKSSFGNVDIFGPDRIVLTGNGTVDIAAANATTMRITADIVGTGNLNFASLGNGVVRVDNDLDAAGDVAVVSGGLLLSDFFGENVISPSSIDVGDAFGPVGSAVFISQRTDTFTDMNVYSDGIADLSDPTTIADLFLDGGTVGGGGSIDLTSSLLVLSNPVGVTISNDLKLNPGVSANIGNGAAATDLLLSGVVSGSGATTFTGNGTTRLGGANSNTFTGTLRVRGGTLELAKPVNVRAAGDIEVGMLNAVVPATVRLVSSSQIADADDITVSGMGTFDLNDLNETANNISVNAGGKITTGSGDLTATNSALVAGGGQVIMDNGGRLVINNVLTGTSTPGNLIATITGGQVNLNGGQRTIATIGLPGSSLVIDSPLTNGSVVKTGSETLFLDADTASVVPITINAGRVAANGNLVNSDITLTSGTLSGGGAVEDIVATGGTITPGFPINPLETGSVSANAATTFAMSVLQVNDNNRINATGSVNLGGAQLTLTAPVAVPAGSTFTLIQNDGADPIQGTFAGLPQGSIVVANGQSFRISYVGGPGGNDVVLTALAKTFTFVFVSSGDRARAGQTITLTAEVSGLANPSGTVRFFDGAAVLGEAQLDGTGTATLPASFAEGPHSITAAYLGDEDALGSASGPTVLGVFPELYAVGAGAGGAPIVTLHNADGSTRMTINAFANTFAGGVRTATADVNNDGFPDIIAGTGPGVATQVKVFDGKTGAEIFSVAPFEAAFTGGVYVAAGRLNSDGFAEIVITPDEGGGPRVKIINGKDFSTMADYFGIDDVNFRGGARVACADLDADGFDDLLVAAGFGGGPRVAGFDGEAIAKGDTTKKLFPDYFAFEQALRNGVFLTGGDFDGDGMADLAVGGGPGGGPRVTVFDGKKLLDTGTPTAVSNFFAGDPANRGGVRLSVKQLTADGGADLVAGSGTGGGSKVTAYDGELLLKGNTDALHQFDAFPGFVGGVYVG